jgi:hypothetical protein
MIKSLLDNIYSNNLVESKSDFNSIILQKVKSLLDEKRKEIYKTKTKEAESAEE